MKPSRHARRGLAVIEAALAMPILVVLLLAITEYGWVFNRALVVENAARVGARIAVMPNRTISEVEAAVLAVMTANNLEDHYTLMALPDILNMEAGTEVRVVIEVPYSAISLTGGTLIPLPTTLRAAVSMNKEGFE